MGTPSSDRGTAVANTIAVWVIATVALIYLLRAASQLLIPIVLGVLVSYALEPVVAWLARHGLPRLAGTSLIMLILLGGLGYGAYSLKDNIRSTVDALPRLAEKTGELIRSTGMSDVLQPGGSRSTGTEESGQPPSGRSAAKDPAGGVSMPGSMSMSGLLQQGVTSAVSLLGHFTVIVFLVFFLLLSGHHVRDRLVEISGPDTEHRRTTAKILDDINAQIQRFLLVRLVTAAVVALLTWAVLAWMNVENAAIWGILAGVFNSIPYFGPIIVSGGLLVVGLAQGDGLVRALQMSGAALVITSLEGWLLTPPLMGKAERMSALAVFLGLLLWTWIWGAWGTILAVPMLVVIKSVGDHVAHLKPLGRLMAP
jgi:predicted PurR-regulated permease PerM